MPSRGAAWIPLVMSVALLGCGSPPSSTTAQDAPSPAAEPIDDLKKLSGSPHVRFGVPVDADPRDDYLMDRGAYVASYNRNRNEANWVAWRLTRDDLGTVERSDDFRADERLPAELRRVVPSDYRASGY